MTSEFNAALQTLKASGNFAGRHILMDVQTSTGRGIGDTGVIYSLLEELSSVLDMTLVYPPLVAKFPFASNELSRFVQSLKDDGVQPETVGKMQALLGRRQNEEAGVSGITVWLESHAAIHTWTEENFFSFDAYSCKDFDADFAFKFVLKYFDVASVNGLDIVRTIGAPQRVRTMSLDGQGEVILAPGPCVSAHSHAPN
jgi:S-adenosylmethionine decarboxylase